MALESKAVLAYLATVSEAVDVRTMADALNCADSTSELNLLLGGLVRNLKVKRHHKADGILRYSLPVAPPKAHDTPLAKAPPPAVSLTHEAPKPRPIERIRLLLADAKQPATANDLCSALHDLPANVVRSAIYNAVHKKELESQLARSGGGKVFCLPGQFVTAVAVATATASATPVNATNDDADRAPEPVPDKQDKGLHVSISADARGFLPLAELSLQMAEKALENYILASVDARVYEDLKASVSAARATRDYFRDGDQP